MEHNSAYYRTEKAIVHTFILLLKEKPFEKITVQDILENTPVTRATFYAHFRDKYEIAEKLQTRFLEIQDTVRSELRFASPQRLISIQHKYYVENRDLIQALLKIHTDKVDVRQVILADYEHLYLSTSDTPNQKIEARIYAQARAEFHLAIMNEEAFDYSFKNSNDIFLSVALHLLRLDDDPEVYDFLEKKLNQKFTK